ncbi:hypothetical protein KTT66_07985 [Lacticaseibacillus casei]|uniref:Uncharacterized protein n=1 Tax=Lacticaseibacillus huelsenbergensis TaxID=3035291 RepID=A0ABY8DXH9_9LACO|nr:MULTISPECIES: hypothetical protein [Lacticaseibacillus]MDG3062116.1 hypothetical protein [Lacticaseibacillus sp. BCRC 81376]QVI36342.1 hypothetical protein KGS74_08745 [Lacticaseibacillus casei]QXG58143.1 hypothetical protein KTT66_07985 [Lacticaseibacillus casei]WFB40385.1 hypothetical protein LHUE1_001172 [Lacticaseibacillus huelsenbergensis]WFB42138.1 hypothetical protein LHUE2_000096 [Lacticaseibacillus huelsenbergensis]
MTTQFDRTINIFAKGFHVSDLLEKEKIENFVVFTINNLSSYDNLMHATVFLSAIAGFFEQSNLPLRIQVMQIPLSDNKSKVDFIAIRLLDSEYNRAVQKLEDAYNQNKRNTKRKK